MTATSAKFRSLQLELNHRYQQRHDAIEAIVIALATKEHAFLLGPPGTAKSMLVRDAASVFTGANYFEILMSKNRPDQAVLGPYDIQKLREESAFVRKDEGFLTTAHIAFIDEAGKMSPTVGHDMLAALNERIKHEVSGGRSAHRIPLCTAIAASNEHPATASDDAAALWDRLLLRAPVEYLRSGSDFSKMLTAEHRPMSMEITLDELDFAADMEVAAVQISDGTVDAVFELRDTFRQEGFIVSDRRWRAAMKAVKATAWLRDSDVTEPEDLAILRLILWDQLDTFEKVRRLVMKVTSPIGEELLELQDDLDVIKAGHTSRASLASRERLAQFQADSPKLAEIRTRSEMLEGKVSNLNQKAEIVAFRESISTWYSEAMSELGLGGF